MLFVFDLDSPNMVSVGCFVQLDSGLTITMPGISQNSHSMYAGEVANTVNFLQVVCSNTSKNKPQDKSAEYICTKCISPESLSVLILEDYSFFRKKMCNGVEWILNFCAIFRHIG